MVLWEVGGRRNWEVDGRGGEGQVGEEERATGRSL